MTRVHFPLMRLSLAGVLALVILLTSGTVFGQAKAEVEKIGFENRYRPDCWTSLVVRLTPETSKADNFQLQVKQEDLDRDHPIFTRTISLTGNTEGSAVREQRFRVYFKPQPTDGGLPDANEAGRNTAKDLQEQLHVSLCTVGGKFIAPVPITTTIINVDPRTSAFSDRRGTRLILFVTDGNSRPSWAKYELSLGLLEDVEFVGVRPDELPENVLGYDAVDGIVWMGADPAELKSGGDERYRALETYVRRGGHLVICTTLEWQKLLGFGDLLPVMIESMDIRQDTEPMRSIVSQTRYALDTEARNVIRPWDQAKGPFNVARATAREGSMVQEWVTWNNKTGDRSPWLVRKVWGSGGVTWVAQDLGAASLTRPIDTGWPQVWDYVFGWKNRTKVETNQISEREKAEFAKAVGVDVGYSLLSGMELQGKSATLIVLAVVFFIGYWLVAGPGVYAYLATRRQTAASWFAFAASALAATLLTVLLVKLTLRGAPEMKHMSLVRAASGPAALNDPAYVYSRFGLYIPRDGAQQIELKDMARDSVAAITAFGVNPQHLDNGKVPEDPGPEYYVSVRDPASDERARISVPYRSTLKKFEADWTGPITGKVQGQAKLIDSTFIEGSITNATGMKLKNVYVAFNYPNPAASAKYGDWILYLPSLDAGATIDLNKEFNTESDATSTKNLDIGMEKGRSPERGMKVRGRITQVWQPYWYGKLKGTSFTERGYDDSNDRSGVRASFPLLSFFQRLEPAMNKPNETPDRFELLRRGARKYDCSAALACGGLVVVAEPDGPSPIPIPMEVEGDKIEGTGATVYQFVLPLDTSVFNKTPSTQPLGE